MITLLTGNPGAGKTAQLVEWLRTIYTDRPLYVQGLEGLSLAHEPVDAARWHLDVPDGSIVVVDEVQNVWRPRGPGHAPHDSVKALETHRHRGVDFFLTTQKPTLVDSNVRALVGRHVHIRDTGWLGRYIYEWPECSENLAWKTCHLKRKFKLPKKAFDLYKSSNLHTTVQKSRSMMPLITGALVLVAMLLVFLVYRTVASKVEAKPAAQAASAPGPALGSNVVRGQGVLSASELRASFVPRLAAQPNSAPAYDDIRKVVAMPRIMGGYCQAKQCHCFIQDGRRAPIDARACYEWLKNPPFDPYYLAPEARDRQDYSKRAAASASAPV